MKISLFQEFLTNSAQLTFESTGSGGIFYDPNDSTKASDPTIDISVADQSNYNFNWRYEPSDSDKLNPNGISIIVGLHHLEIQIVERKQ